MSAETRACRTCLRDLALTPEFFARPPGRRFYKDCKDCVRAKKQREYQAFKATGSAGRKAKEVSAADDADLPYASSPLGRTEAFLFPGVIALTRRQREAAIAFCKRRLGLAP